MIRRQRPYGKLLLLAGLPFLLYLIIWQVFRRTPQARFAALRLAMKREDYAQLKQLSTPDGMTALVYFNQRRAWLDRWRDWAIAEDQDATAHFYTDDAQHCHWIMQDGSTKLKLDFQKTAEGWKFDGLSHIHSDY